MDKKVINNIRALSLDMISSAKSGHTGICLGAAPIIYTLFSNHLNFNIENGLWINRDRFILSAGHGSAMLYSTLFLAGYPIILEDIKNFRQIGSTMTGHPELNPEIGIEMTTGPLGEGFATSVGFAIAEEYLRTLLGKNLIDHYTYVLVGDGDLMEGISYEAASLAGSLELGRLIVLYDSNNISLDGETSGVFDENVLKRFEACGWHTEYVSNADEIENIDKAINNAKSIIDKPSIIEIKSIIGKSAKYEGTNKIHGQVLSETEVLEYKNKLGINEIPFHVSKDSTIYFRDKIEKRITPIYNEWIKAYNEVFSKNDSDKNILELLEKNNFKIDLSKVKVHLEKNQNEELRVSNGKLMNLLNELMPLFISGSADLFNSTKTYLEKGEVFNKNNRRGKNIYFGVRENLMSSVLNGLALNGIKSVGSTFLTFSDYMKPGLRLSAMMKLPVTYIFTHDSINIGEDGPTHEPVEQLGMLRSIPNMVVFRPCDINELVGSWDYIINNNNPVSLVVSKTNIPNVMGSSLEKTEKGGYIVKKEKGRLVANIIATGSEVNTAINISDELDKKAIFTRVISIPSLELFKIQNEEYKKSVIADSTKTIVIEASNDKSWNEFVYNNKYLLNIKEFGLSGKSEDVLKTFNFDYDSLFIRVEILIK